MKRKVMLSLICAAAMALSACGSMAADLPVTSAPIEQEDVTAEGQDADEKTESGADQGTDSKGEKTVRLSIDGYDADHIPRLDGSLANEPLLIRMMMELTGADEELAEAYLSGSFENGGTSTSWGKLAYDMVDLIVSYEAPDEIKESYAEELDSLEIEPLGCDGLVFIVNKDNPIDSLTIDQIRDIYTGKITDWSEVGGAEGPIVAYQRNSTSGSQTLFNKLVMKGEKAMDPGSDLLVGSMGGLIESVASFDGSGSAIGFSVYYYADKMKADPNLKLISVEGVEPSNASIEDHSYPLVNDFYVAIRADEAKKSPARMLRDWLLSDQGKALLEEEGYVWAR